jgi:acyl carrier protein
LYLGGAGLARGYLNRPDLTAEKFLPDPFSELPGARLYRTGDLGRYLPDGQIEFLGRVDNQVKVRGFRIELGDVESALRQHPHLEDVVVVARDDNAESKRLVAYVVADRETKPTVSELRSFLGERLPDYMIPSAFVMLDRLPQTPSGKIDRRALPEPTEERPELEAAYVAPRTPVEETLADIVGQVLGVDRVGIRDNFFELGGHSMLAIQVISQVRELFQVDVPLRSLFESPTVEGLAVAIARTQAEVEDREKLEQMLSELEQLSEEEVKTLLTEDLTSGDRS